MSIDRDGEKAINDELGYLADLVRRHRDLTMAEVSAPTLRYLLACERMQRVLDETKRLGTESPLRTATQFAAAQEAKWNAAPAQPASGAEGELAE